MVLGKAAYALSSAAVVLECARQQVMTAGETVLQGFKFLVRSGRGRFAARFTPIEIGTRKPPASTWQVHAAWDVENRGPHGQVLDRGVQKRA